jgi:hypothetical protein
MIIPGPCRSSFQGRAKKAQWEISGYNVVMETATLFQMSRVQPMKRDLHYQGNLKFVVSYRESIVITRNK